MEAVLGSLMQKLDKKTQDNIKSITLMETAGKKMADIILKYYSPKSVLLLCGSGGNSGDALVVGRILLEKGIKVKAFIKSEIKNTDAKVNLELFKGDIINNLDELSSYDLIVDGLFGIGLSRELSNEYIDIINKVNNSGIDIVSLDIPSGIDSNNGLSYGAYIKASLLITVEYPKVGLFLNDGIASYKRLEIINIGIMHTNDTINILSIEQFRGLYKERMRNTNKGSFGKSSIVAGSINYPGASLLSYNALISFKMGVGYQNLYVISSLYNMYALVHPEIITNKLSEEDGHIKYNEEELNDIMKHSDSISIGMGMKVSSDLYNSIKYLLMNYDKTLIIDADGLNSLSKYGVDILANKKCKVILTPHLKEFERLSGYSVNEIKNDSINIAIEFARKYDITLVLKSQTTIITDGNRLSINISGNSGLAKAGSGDSLVGILSGICGYFKENDIFINACLASYMLGRIAEKAKEKLTEEAMTISEAVSFIPDVIKELKAA